MDLRTATSLAKELESQPTQHANHVPRLVSVLAAAAASGGGGGKQQEVGA